MPSPVNVSVPPSSPSLRLDRLLHHMDASHSEQPPTFTTYASLSVPQHTQTLNHSTSYTVSLTSHHTAVHSASSTSEAIQPRRLQRSDYSKGFLSLLSQLTDVGDVSDQQFSERFDELSRIEETQQVWVIEDEARAAVIATATLLVELKFIHGVSKVSQPHCNAPGVVNAAIRTLTSTTAADPTCAHRPLHYLGRVRLLWLCCSDWSHRRRGSERRVQRQEPRVQVNHRSYTHSPASLRTHRPVPKVLCSTADLLSCWLWCGVLVCGRLIAHLLAVSRSCGCYKVILDCNDQNVPFYEKLGFKKHVNHMQQRFDGK